LRTEEVKEEMDVPTKEGVTVPDRMWRSNCHRVAVARWIGVGRSD